MAEYIEREALIHSIKVTASEVIFRGCNEMITGKDSCNPAEWTKGYEKGVRDVADKICECSAADVVEVVHGHWISQQEAETINDYGKAYCCSICGHCDWDCTESESFNYCPHCGAKMDGERRSE